MQQVFIFYKYEDCAIMELFLDTMHQLQLINEKSYMVIPDVTREIEQWKLVFY